MAKSYSPETEALIEAVLAKAPACLQDKALLQSIDWGKVDGANVSTMLANLADANKKAPPWLLNALVIAGHVLDETPIERQSLPLKFLNRLNGTGDLDKNTASDVATRLIDNKDLTLALVKQMKARGLPDEALQLALTNAESAPQLLRPVSTELKVHAEDLPPVNLRVLGTSTTHPFCDDLAPAFASAGFKTDIVEANFGEVIPELLRPVERQP